MCVNLSWELKKTNHSVPHGCNVFQQSETCFTEDCPGRMSPQDFVSLIMGHYVTNVPCVIGSSLPNTTIELLLANWSLLLGCASRWDAKKTAILCRLGKSQRRHEIVRHLWVAGLMTFLLQLWWYNRGYTLWLCNIAMENGPFIDGLPIKNSDFPWLC